ncbi:MAG: glycosyltransferase [Planctomycetota bacterium]|jgi:glycosyltransferase involved in cell wall biosynthesis
MPIRLAYVSEIPTPYRRPFLRQLAEDSEVALTVLYCAASQGDREWTDEPLEDFETVLPGFHWCTNRAAGYYNRFNPAIFRQLSKANFDMVIFGAYSVMTMWTAMHWCRLQGLPYALLCESHGRRKRSGWRVSLKRTFIAPLIRGASAWLPLGSLARDYLVEMGAEAARCHRCPNTPDAHALSKACESLPAIPALRRRFDLPEEVPLFLSIGRFIEIKRIDLILTAFRALQEQHPGAHLALAGSGPQEEAYRQQIESEGIRNVHFLGFQQKEALPALYRMSDGMILASDDEPWAVVVNEAMACGCKVIASDRVGAAFDLICEPETGYSFPAGDAAALTAVMAAFLGEGPCPRTAERACVDQALDWAYPRCHAAIKAAIEDALP